MLIPRPRPRPYLQQIILPKENKKKLIKIKQSLLDSQTKHVPSYKKLGINKAMPSLLHISS